MIGHSPKGPVEHRLKNLLLVMPDELIAEVMEIPVETIQQARERWNYKEQKRYKDLSHLFIESPEKLERCTYPLHPGLLNRYDKQQIEILRSALNKLWDRKFELYEEIEGVQARGGDWSNLSIQRAEISAEIVSLDARIHRLTTLPKIKY